MSLSASTCQIYPGRFRMTMRLNHMWPPPSATRATYPVSVCHVWRLAYLPRDRRLPSDSTSRWTPLASPSGSGHHGPQRSCTSHSHAMPGAPPQAGECRNGIPPRDSYHRVSSVGYRRICLAFLQARALPARRCLDVECGFLVSIDPNDLSDGAFIRSWRFLSWC